jgi:hypothetical protein
MAEHSGVALKICQIFKKKALKPVESFLKDISSYFSCSPLTGEY